MIYRKDDGEVIEFDLYDEGCIVGWLDEDENWPQTIAWDVYMRGGVGWTDHLAGDLNLDWQRPLDRLEASLILDSLKRNLQVRWTLDNREGTNKLPMISFGPSFYGDAFEACLNLVIRKFVDFKTWKPTQEGIYALNKFVEEHNNGEAK